MDPAQIQTFRQLLAQFHAQADAPRGDIARFQFLCDQMFTVFGVAGASSHDPSQSAWVGLMPKDDNLDTGNAPFPAPARFMATFLEQAGDSDGLRGYYGGFAREDLRAATTRFLVAHAAIPEAPYEVVAGCGTVHLYDLLCRHLIRRPDDIVLGAHPVYGFFVPHAERASGRTVLLAPDDGSRCSAGLVRASIERLHRECRTGWLETVGQRTELFLAALGSRYRLTAGAAWRAAAVRAVSEVAAQDWPAGPAACDAQYLTLLQPFLAEQGLTWAEAARFDRRLPTVPRVVAWLHINPTQAGDVYGQQHVDDLAAVLAETQVLPIEDLSYHSVRAPLPSIGSFLRRGVPTHLLLGLSKPFSLANCRVGLLVMNTGDGYELGRMVENSAGWMPTFHQLALRDLFDSPDVGEMLDWRSRRSPHSYERRCRLALATLRGSRDGTLPAEIRAEIRAFAEATAAELAALGSGSSPDPRSLVDAFVEQGLDPWFEVPRPPEAGFFLMADCSRLLASPLGRSLGLTCSFDVFAGLAYFTGVHTIPEEAMTVGSMRYTPRLLRLSFSVPERTWVRACFLIHVALTALSRLTDPQEPAARQPYLSSTSSE